MKKKVIKTPKTSKVATKASTKSEQIPILYEDTDILAINKPAGLVVHADGKTDEPTLVDWILKKFPKTKNVGEPIILTPNPDGTDAGTIERPGIVHRLDRDTSGVLLIAKTPAGFEHLKAQFVERTIKKAYHAFVYGEMKDERGSIDLPIARSKSDFRKWTAQRGKRGEVREALTTYTVLDHVPAVSYIEARPLTGRTHQIRVHFKAIHHPVVGDRLYAEGKPTILGFRRHALHALRIQFENCDGKTVQVEAPLPADFEKALTALAELKKSL